MNTAELKLDIIAKISSIQEVRIIEELKKMLDFELENPIYRLNKEQIERIEEARKDTVISEKEANLEIEQWLKGK
jgi:hypothetical protein